MNTPSGLCMFVMHDRCNGGPADYPCGCGCHQLGAAPAPSRDRTTPPRDLTGQVNKHGLITLDLLVGGRRTGATLKPDAAAQFLRELADDVEHAAPPMTATT